MASVSELLIAEGGESHVCFLQVLTCAITLGGRAGSVTLAISVPKALGPGAKPFTQVSSLSLSPLV